MLNRSFKPAKCKTALKLAASRIKLLKNKREAQVKQLKRELAELLQSGQDRTAMIRVEHVVREEKTLSAYELIEIYCELIVARLPIIESQKNCPIDLKEAIASVVFASPRCADVPELGDVRKHFTAKYGKEFVSAAQNLRPDCGVGRMLIEKLSVIAPDGPAKIKILKSIAEEHNIKWDPSVVNDPKPPEDLLNGPSTFDKASQMHTGPPNAQVRPDFDGRGPSHGEKSDIPANLYDHNKRSGQYTQSDAHTNMATNRATFSGPSRPEARPPGNGNQWVEVRHSYSGNGRDLSSGRQNWNMEFKDAAEAAQAAAESADRASMAARAAAELSSQANFTRLNDSEPHGSYGLRGDLPDRHSSSNFEDQHVGKDQAASSFHGRVPKVQSEQINETDQDNMGGGVDERFYKHDNWSSNKSNQRSSLKSQGPSSGDRHEVNSSQMSDMYPENNSVRSGRSDFTGQMSFDKSSSKAGFESVNEEQNDMKTENIYYPEEIQIKKQSSRTSRSHSETFSNDRAAVLDPDNDASENPFAVTGEGSFQNDTKQTSSHDKAPLVFDDSGSDDEEDVFDALSSRRQESSLFFSSPGRKSPIHLSTHTNVWSPRQNVSHSVFSEGHPIASQSDDVSPVAFDDSDAPSSESEEDPEKYKHVGNLEHTTSLSRHESSFVVKESESDRKLLSQSFSNEVHPYGSQGVESSSKFQGKFGVNDFPSKLQKPQVLSDDNDSYSSDDPVVEGTSSSQQLSRPLSLHGEVKDNFHPPQVSDTIRYTEVVEESSLGSGSELNLGQLTGGLRNKGYRLPPYNRNPSGNAFFTKQAVEDTPRSVAQSPSTRRVGTNVGSGGNWQESYSQNTRTRVNEKPSSRASDARLDDEDMCIGVNQMSSSRSPPTYSDSANSDSEENLPKQTAISKPRLGTGLSRRTKAYPEHSDRPSPKKATVLSGKETTVDLEAERYETSTEPHFETKSSFHMGDLDWARKVAEPVSKPIPDSNRPSPRERKVAEPVSKPVLDSNWTSPRERKVAEPVSKPIPDSNRRYPVDRNLAEPVSKPIPDSSRPSPRERKVAEPVSKPVLDSNRSSPRERKVAEPVSKPIPDSNRRYPVDRNLAEPVYKPIPDSSRPSPRERKVVEPVSKQVLDSSRSSSRERKAAEPVSRPVLDSNRSSPRERKAAEPVSKPIPDSNRPSLTSNASGLSAAGSKSKDQPSHVHPNLPDIDAITAHLQSLRKNRG